MLLPRVITALVGIPITLILVHIGNLPFISFVFTIIILSLYEYAVLMKLGAKPLQNFTLFFFGVLLCFSLILDFGAGPFPRVTGLAAPVFTTAVIFAFFAEFFAVRKYIERIALTLLGIFMLPWCLSFLVGIRDIRPDGEAITYILLISVWTMDTAAYFVGKTFGSRRLSPISPKKTWEGAVAGFAGALVGVFLLRNFLETNIGIAAAWGFGIMVGILGQVSDIAESMIKRSVGAKDSSSVLPGHGGILDRCDSYIFLAPAVYYFFMFFGNSQ